MKKGKVLITEPVHELLPKGLVELGFEVVHLPEITRAEALEVIQDFEGLIINSKVVANRELLLKATQLKFVARCGSGKEVIDFKYCVENEIIPITSPEGNRQAVAEHALGMLLSLLNNIHKASREVAAKKWLREKNRGFELYAKTIGIIGFGNTGEAFAEVLRGFNPTILAYDKYRKNFGNNYIVESNLNEIFEHADVLSLHLPLSEETKYFANQNFFLQFKKPIWFVNTSRGNCVNTKDLLNSIQEEKILGAALDVLENEKLETYTDAENEIFKQLLETGKVLITPHIAGWTHESKRKIAEVLLQKISECYR
ncbi:MAG: hydroxyacid dehydrogenase [Chitinophagales bacterium]|jgi:D-3-phosphoglycerate dehydrogenase|nr:hydroxyacid dehydrogenase [Chitinophagales bacterium]